VKSAKGRERIIMCHVNYYNIKFNLTPRWGEGGGQRRGGGGGHYTLDIYTLWLLWGKCYHWHMVILCTACSILECLLKCL
jgi:hypothetical protein